MKPTRGAFNEIIPGLYQRGNFLKWPYDQKRLTLQRHGISVVFNLWNKVDPDLSGQVLYVNWPIAGNAMPEHAELMVTYAASLHAAGEILLVHCEAGVNRSAWFCAEIVARALDCSYDEALARVQRKVPRANPHRAFDGGAGS